MRKVNFDLDALRSFCVGIELGSFAKAADKLGRSTSAISAQLKKLEEQAGTQILRKAGRLMAPTDAGEVLLSYARRILELNDEASMALGGMELEGCVRLGLQEDFGEHLLPEVLGRFARSHPGVRIEARIMRNTELVNQVQTARLDLALAWQAGNDTPHMEALGAFPLQWIGPANKPIGEWFGRGEPLPLIAFEAPCMVRTIGTEALDRAGIPWRIVFTSPSLSGIWAAVTAGLGITVRSSVGVSANLRALRDEEFGLPVLPALGLALHRTEAEPVVACRRLHEIIRENVAALHDGRQNA